MQTGLRPESVWSYKSCDSVKCLCDLGQIFPRWPWSAHLSRRARSADPSMIYPISSTLQSTPLLPSWPSQSNFGNALVGRWHWCGRLGWPAARAGMRSSIWHSNLIAVHLVHMAGRKGHPWLDFNKEKGRDTSQSPGW